MLSYALTIFTGAFLLFQVQPLIGKYILPWFGGGPGVWTTCLLFFQTLLLGGYAYAHCSSRWLKPRAQAVVHLLLLAGALAMLPVTPADAWKPRGDENPTLHILLLLTVCLGLPYFVLSSTGPLMQHWFTRTNPGVSPYRLYALSNAGSLLALVSYPFFVETHFTRQTQAASWAWGFGAYALVAAVCAGKLWKAKLGDDATGAPDGAAEGAINLRPSPFTQLLWLLLPACASVLLLATTNKVCQDVAVIPFLWVLPLALYLLSFIICFDSPRWYVRPPFALALAAGLAGVAWMLFQDVDTPLRLQVSVYVAGLFACCMVCHGELYRLRPDPRQLTGFYLMIAAGGALGGLLVAVVAPLVFTDYHELHWGLAGCGLLFLVVCAREITGDNLRAWRWMALLLTLAVFVALDRALAWQTRDQAMLNPGQLLAVRVGMWGALAVISMAGLARGWFRPFRAWRLLACIWLAAGWVALTGTLWVQARGTDRNIIARSRNFYGTLKLCEYRRNDPENHYLLLQHGRITHGLQLVDSGRSRWPVSYYCDTSGVALAIKALPVGARHIGVVGLGAGTLAAHGRAGDTVRFYEINPQVHQLALTRFTYLSNSPANVEIAMGDARLSLERESPQQFDLLALDAFSSDSIPVHLLTREAFELYNRHLKSGGVIAVHISNRYLDLEPVVANLARHFQYELAIINYEEDEGDDEDDPAGQWWAYASTWALLTRNHALVNHPDILAVTSAMPAEPRAIPLWTDDFVSLYQVFK